MAKHRQDVKSERTATPLKLLLRYTSIFLANRKVMATLLLWVNWRHAKPDCKVWRALRTRAQQRSGFAGIERSGPGYCLYAAPTRCAEPEVLIEQRSHHGGAEILMLDRAVGPADDCMRSDMQWTDARLLDGTPNASIRIDLESLAVSVSRDLIGQRALVYARVNGGLIVASGEHVLRAHPEVSGDLDEAFLAANFAGVDWAHCETVYRDVRMVAPGETRVWRMGTASSTRITMEPDWSWKSMTDAAIVERFKELLSDSVSQACLGARRVGISLSAGLDSSSIAAFASRLSNDLTHGVLGVTYGLDTFPDIDERDMVAGLAATLGIELQTFQADDLLPFSEPSLRPICPDTPFQWIYREWIEQTYRFLANAGVDVCLNGAFGDHLFSGGVEWAVDACRYRRWRRLRAGFGDIARQSGLRGLLRDTSARRPISRMLGRVRVGSDRINWLNEPFARTLRDRLRSEHAQFRHFPRPGQCTLLLSARASFEASNENWYSHRHGIERRLPFADPHLVRWCLSVPADFSRRHGFRKWMLRESVGGLLPENLRGRPKGSSLEPFFAKALVRQGHVLSAMARRCESVVSRYYRIYPTLANDREGMRVWLAACFSAWSDAASLRERAINR